jgi:hypothetical protein
LNTSKYDIYGFVSLYGANDWLAYVSTYAVREESQINIIINTIMHSGKNAKKIYARKFITGNWRKILGFTINYSLC